MSDITPHDRIVGALMGAFVGDALALGPHWYYNLDQQRRDYGDWIDDYTDPQKGRYHEGLKAGDSSQAGVILALTLRSLADCGGYDEKDFCDRLDKDLFPKLTGEPYAGPGGYTSQSMRDTWQGRQAGKPWGEIASWIDNTEAAERCLAIAVRYASEPKKLAESVSANVGLTQKDPTVGAMTLAYGLVLGQLVTGAALDEKLSMKLMAKVKRGAIPFHGDTPEDSRSLPFWAGQFASPDALLTASFIAQAAQDPEARIEPAWKVSLFYGMPCAVYHQFPAAYYLAAHFQDDYQSAVLHAINGGGQNQARAILTGALCGAIGGIDVIPKRFIDGLKESEAYRKLAESIAADAEKNSDSA